MINETDTIHTKKKKKDYKCIAVTSFGVSNNQTTLCFSENQKELWHQVKKKSWSGLKNTMTTAYSTHLENDESTENVITKH